MSSFAQKELIVHEIVFENEAASTVLTQIEDLYHVKFSYAADLIKGQTIQLDKEQRSLEDVLFEIAPQIHVDFNKLNKTYIYLTKSKTQQINDVLINSYLTKGISKTKNANFTMSPKRLGLLAGLTETDILESIQQLPGVISIDETATGLSVRGGTTDQNNIIWDGIHIYHSGHLFGMVSVFNPNIAQNITFYNKGTNAAFGERVSSVINIETATKIPTKTSAEFGFNGIDADAFIKTPLIAKKLSFQVSFRRSYEDFFETKTFKNYEEKAFQNTKILEEKFHFKDYNIKLNYKPNSKNDLAFSLIHIDNDLINETNNIVDNHSYTDILDSENNGYSLQWNRQWKDNIQQETLFSSSKYLFYYNFITRENNVFKASFLKENTIQNSFFKTAFTFQLANHKKLAIGYQNSNSAIAFSFKEKENISYLLDSDDSKLSTHALYTNYNYSFNDFDLYAGLRLNYYQQLDALRLEPRLVLNKKINNHFSLQFTAEVKNQAITQIDETVLSDLALENKLWRLADGTHFPIINSHQFSSGFSYNKDKWTADFDLYYKKTNGITALALGFLNPNDNVFHKGAQKTIGFDIYFKRDFNKIKTWFSYSFLDAKNKYEDLNNGQYFTSNTEIKHSANASISYRHKQFQLALGWKWRTGKPLTDLDYDMNGTAFFDGINTETIKSYHRLDLSTTYKFHFTKKGATKGKVGFSFRNVYNNRNHISTYFKGNNTLNDPVRIIENHAIGITPNFMFRIYW